MFSREQVYRAINTEREYQDARWGTTLSGNRLASPEEGGLRTVDEFVLYINGYANELARIGATESDTAKKLAFVRKVAGLCVACMEQHGAPHRSAEELQAAHDAATKEVRKTLPPSPHAPHCGYPVAGCTCRAYETSPLG